MRLRSLTWGHLVETRSSLWIKRASNSRDQNPCQTPCFGESTTTRGRKGTRLSFSFIFKNQFRLAVYQSVSRCSAGEPHCFLVIAHLSCLWGVLPQMKSFSLSPSPFGCGEENENNVCVPFLALFCNYRLQPPQCVCAHTHSHRKTKQSNTPGCRHTAEHSGENRLLQIAHFWRRE